MLNLLEREWKLAVSAKLFLILTALQPVLYLVIYAGPMTNLVGDIRFQGASLSYFAFVLPGTIVMAASQYGLQGSSSLYMERVTGELEELLAAPIHPLRLVLARALANGIYTLVYMGIAVVLYRILSGNIVLTPTAILVCIFTCIITAISMTMLFCLLSIFAPSGRAFGVLTSILGFPLLFFSSVFYPVDNFDPIFREFVTFNPLSLGADLLRQSFFLPDLQQVDVFQRLALLSGMTLILIIVTGTLLRRAIR